jgi:polyisoprenoid-binding protein YceI
VLVGSSIWSVKPRGLLSRSYNLDLNQHPFVGFVLKGREYGIVATSFSLFDTLFKFQFINSKHKLLKSEIVMNNSQN